MNKRFGICLNNALRNVSIVSITINGLATNSHNFGTLINIDTCKVAGPTKNAEKFKHTGTSIAINTSAA